MIHGLLRVRRSGIRSNLTTESRRSRGMRPPNERRPPPAFLEHGQDAQPPVDHFIDDLDQVILEIHRGHDGAHHVADRPLRLSPHSLEKLVVRQLGEVRIHLHIKEGLAGLDRPAQKKLRLESPHDVPPPGHPHELVLLVEDQDRPREGFPAVDFHLGLLQLRRGLAKGKPVWKVRILIQGNHDVPCPFHLHSRTPFLPVTHLTDETAAQLPLMPLPPGGTRPVPRATRIVPQRPSGPRHTARATGSRTPARRLHGPCRTAPG